MTGQAMAMRMCLARLGAQHAVAPSQPRILTLLEPVDHDMRVSGIAVLPTIDLERTKFRSYAFSILPWSKDFPPLRYRHGAQDVGRIESLKL